MAFLPYSYNDGQPRPFEYYKLSVAGSIEIGTAMALSGGKLAASATPAYICMRTEKSAAADTVVPVIRIDGGIVFEAPLAEAMTSLKPGARTDVSDDGQSIAKTTANSNIEIVAMDGTAKDSLCRVRFVG